MSPVMQDGNNKNAADGQEDDVGKSHHVPSEHHIGEFVSRHCKYDDKTKCDKELARGVGGCRCGTQIQATTSRIEIRELISELPILLL